MRIKSTEFEKYRATKEKIKAKGERVAMLTELLNWHIGLCFAEQDRFYIASLRRRLAKTRSELRNMEG